MRNTLIAAFATAAVAFGLAAPSPAAADGIAAARPAKAHAAKPAKAHIRYYYARGLWPGGPDPYAYSYERPGYYPSYDSNKWVPRHQMLGRSKYPFRIPEYYSSWGYPLTCKIQSRRHCGVAFQSPAGDPRQYYRRDVQLPAHHQQR